MAEAFIQTLKQMVVFILAGQTILVLGLGKQYEKYLRLLISLMIAANMTAAFGSLLGELPFLGSRLQTGAEDTDFIKRWEENVQAFEEELKGRQQEMEEGWKEMNGMESFTEPTQGGRRIVIEEIVIQ